MRKILVVASAFALASCQQQAGGAKGSATPKTEEEKTFYALGLDMGRRLGVFKMSPAELEMVKAGLTDQVNGVKPQIEVQAYGPKINQLAQKRSQQVSEADKGKVDAEKAKGQAFADKAAGESGAQKTSSGLVYSEMTAGTGASPQPTDNVKVNYRGTLIDGTEFDSSYKRNQPATFPLNQVVPCWTEGVQKMKVGGKAKLVCPSSIAYGDQGHPPTIPGGATLVFEVELLEITAKPALPPGMPQMPPPGSMPRPMNIPPAAGPAKAPPTTPPQPAAPKAQP